MPALLTYLPALKTHQNRAKCGVQHSTCAVVGRKSGRHKSPDADSCTVHRLIAAHLPALPESQRPLGIGYRLMAKDVAPAFPIFG